MKNVYSVKQVNAYIKNMFAQDFMLNRIYVKGEVSNCKYHTSGHIYFSLKDESGSIACIMFAGQRSGLAFRMQDGQQVIALGNVTTYERDGKYQLYAKEIILDGAGLLYEKFEALKKELGEMGMFAEEYKQPIPRFAKKIGIVTAPTGAAIRDIIQISQRRNPYVQILLYPAQVQGEGAAESIVAGIRCLDARHPDCIIVGRGGGSLEDLWAFNEEMVAQAIFDCETPVISAVGHETDTTIADYVSDLRAPTPSAAAELAVYDYYAFMAELRQKQALLERRMQDHLQRARDSVKRQQLKLALYRPEYRIANLRQTLADTEDRLHGILDRRLERERHRLGLLAAQLDRLSPLKRLGGGYAFVADDQDRAIVTVDSVECGDILHVTLRDGKVDAQVVKTEQATLPKLP